MLNLLTIKFMRGFFLSKNNSLAVTLVRTFNENVLIRGPKEKLCKNFESPMKVHEMPLFQKSRIQFHCQKLNIKIFCDIFETFTEHPGEQISVSTVAKMNVDIIVLDCCLIACKLYYKQSFLICVDVWQRHDFIHVTFFPSDLV